MNDGLIHPLSGSEIITDVLAQVEKRLQSDCNLRESDAYSGGYSGTIKISLSLHSIDVTSVELEVPIINNDVPVDDTVSVHEENVEEEIEIPLEADLDAVRSRSDQGVPMEVLDAESGQPTIKKRKYVRHALESGAL